MLEFISPAAESHRWLNGSNSRVPTFRCLGGRFGGSSEEDQWFESTFLDLPVTFRVPRSGIALRLGAPRIGARLIGPLGPPGVAAALCTQRVVPQVEAFDVREHVVASGWAEGARGAAMRAQAERVCAWALVQVATLATHLCLVRVVDCLGGLRALDLYRLELGRQPFALGGGLALGNGSGLVVLPHARAHAAQAGVQVVECLLRRHEGRVDHGAQLVAHGGEVLLDSALERRQPRGCGLRGGRWRGGGGGGGGGRRWRGGGEGNGRDPALRFGRLGRCAHWSCLTSALREAGGGVLCELPNPSPPSGSNRIWKGSPRSQVRTVDYRTHAKYHGESLNLM